MQMVTVAIADKDPGRRAKVEQVLQEGPDIKVLTNILPEGGETFVDQQGDPYATVNADDMVERIGRLKPRILFFHLDPSTGADFALLESLHQKCPETFVVLLTDKSVKEELIMQALASGARGCLSHEAAPFYFLRAVRVIDRGEIWVTRRMLGKIMDKVFH
jgi:DNA-binding NarL/FixJ family response regulator